MIHLSREAGFTYGSGLQTLAGIKTSDDDDAKVRGAPLTLQSGWSYDAAAALASSKQAFIEGTAHKFSVMMEAAIYRLELQMLYGASALGVADSSDDATTQVTATSKVIIPITDASWSSGIWSGSEGAYVSLFLSASPYTASAAAGDDASNTVNKFSIYSVDPTNKTITVNTKDGTEAAALVVEIEAADYDIFFYGAYNAGTSYEMTGLHSILGNTGTLFGINAATYSLWKGNTYACGSANLTLERIFMGQAQAVGRGLLEDVSILVSPSTWSTVANDEAAYRRYNAQVAKAVRGFDSIQFIGPNGKIDIIAHPMMKDSMAFSFPTDKVVRLGASDLTFKRPGSSDQMVQEMATQTGFEVRLYSDQAIFCTCPNKCVLFSGISNAVAQAVS